MADLFAITPTATFTLIGTVLMGLAAGWAALMVMRVVYADRGDLKRGNERERVRRERLRNGSQAYRWFEPLVDELAARADRTQRVTVENLNRALPLVSPLPWTGAEFLAAKWVEGGAAFFAGTFLGHVLFGEILAPIIGFLMAILTPKIVVSSTIKRAERYRVTVRNRLPYLIDLISLMVLSGASLRACLETAMTENAGHPLGDELARVWVLIDNGRAQPEALQTMADRLNEPDVTEVVTVLIAADLKGGKDMPALLQRMAEVLRVRRVQYLERDSERAKVLITWPGMVVMIACLLIVAAVFVIPATAAK